MSRPASAHIERWITIVADLIDPGSPGDAVEALRTLIPFIGGFDRIALSKDTAAKVAEQPRYGKLVPGWDAIAPILRQAVSDARPINFGMLPAPVEVDREPPSDDEKARVAAMLDEALGKDRASKMLAYRSQPIREERP